MNYMCFDAGYHQGSELAGLGRAYPETSEVWYHVYTVEKDGRTVEVGIPLWSSWSIQEYLEANYASL